MEQNFGTKNPFFCRTIWRTRSAVSRSWASDLVIVPALAEPRENAPPPRTPGAEPAQRVTGAGADTASVKELLAITHPRWEPYAGKPHVRI